MWKVTVGFICVCLIITCVLGTANLVAFFLFNLEYQIEKFVCWIECAKRRTPLANFIVKIERRKKDVTRKETKGNSKRS